LKSPVKHCPVIGILGSGPPLQLTVAAGFTVKTDETAVAEAVIMTPVAVATLPEETGNVTLVLPAGIVTEDGTDTTAELPLKSDKTTPPVGAGPAATTVPVEPFPLTTEFGAKARDESPIVAVVTVTEAVPDFVESCVLVAVTVAVVALAGAV
jgi:hypothetical protein